MIFALGFLCAGLAALAFAPAFWRRANRLTRRRLEMQVPLSVQEILADRDQLRAEFAVEQRRLEQRVEEANRAHAADRGELGRRSAEIGDLKERLAQSGQENRDYEQMLAGLQAELTQASAQLGALTKALFDADGLYMRKQEEFASLLQAHEAMTMLAEERLANHAAADARAVGLELRLGDVSRALLEAERRFTERTMQAAKLGDTLALASRNLELSETNGSALQKKLEGEATRAAQIAQELEALRRRREEDQIEMRALAAKIAAREAAIEEASEREKKLRAQRDQQVEKARAARGTLAEKYEQLQSEHAALQGALEVARRRCETLEAELAAQRGRQRARPEENGVLRQEGKEGATIVRLSRAGAEIAPNGGEVSPNGAENPVAGAVASSGEAATPPADAALGEKLEGQVGT